MYNFVFSLDSHLRFQVHQPFTIFPTAISKYPEQCSVQFDFNEELHNEAFKVKVFHIGNNKILPDSKM